MCKSHYLTRRHRVCKRSQKSDSLSDASVAVESRRIAGGVKPALVELQFDNGPCHIRDHLNRRLADSDLEKIVNFFCPTISPATEELLLKAQPPSAAVERSFSILKKVLRSDRPFEAINVKKCLMLCYNQ